ncbi:MAG: hypothetical protein RLZZ244_1449, partial [Verrucomicrobiota bacterium]
MGLLTPWFLLGLLAIAGPLAAHLRRRTVRNRFAFSAVAFLEAQPPRSAKRRWEDLLLLLLRSLALALLALAFARPFFVPRTPPEPSSKPAQLTVLLLDTSASMHRGSLWQDARQRASALAAKLPPDADLELRTFDLSVRTRLPSEQWRQTPPSARPALLQSVLESLQPSWAAARLDLALTEAARAHASLPARSHTQLVLLSDFQQGSSLAGLHGFSWPPRFHVQPFPLTPPPIPTPALLWQPPDPESSPPDAPTKIHVLAPAGLSADSLPLTLEGAPQRELRVPVLPGKSRLASLPLGNLSKARIRVAQSTDFASEIWVASLPQRPALVALNPSTPQAAQGPSSPPSSGYFLANALRALGDSRVLVATADQIAPERDPSIRLWALAGAPPPALLPRIRTSLEQGATGLLLLESPEDAPSLSQLAGIPFRCERRNAEGFALLGSLERTHPLFAPFASASFSDFTSIRFFQFQALSAPDPSPHKILARFDSGEPALLEIPCGKGRLFVWTSSWIPAHSQWALSSRCVPFLSACLDLAEGGPPSW